LKEVPVPEKLIGTVESVIGPVIDVAFSEGNLPEIYDAITITMDDGALLTLEVEQQIGDNVVRTVAMGSTDGVRRGMEAVSDRPADPGAGRPATLGRLFNVTGDPIDGKGEVVAETRYPIHRTAPSFAEQSTRLRCSRRASRSST
jgi:F-type H+-transporting ATPase subunit beta